MKLFQIKDKYVPENWSNKIGKDGILEYFTKETGHKKSKVFKTIEIDFPENPSWLDIVKINIEYGDIVAVHFAERKTAGIVAWAYCNAKTQMYLKSKEHWDKLNPDLANKLFEKLAIIDYFPAICGFGSLDVVKLDELFFKEDKEYNPVECTYKGKKDISSMEYAEIKYGKNVALALRAMI